MAAFPTTTPGTGFFWVGSELAGILLQLGSQYSLLLIGLEIDKLTCSGRWIHVLKDICSHRISIVPKLQIGAQVLFVPFPIQF